MLKILKLQLTFVKFLKRELIKKRNLKEWKAFIKNVTYGYVKAMYTEYKNLFLYLDPEYQKQLKEYNRQNKLKEGLKLALKILRVIDDNMEKQGVARAERRHFWQEFYTSGSIRKTVFDQVEKSLKL